MLLGVRVDGVTAPSRNFFCIPAATASQKIQDNTIRQKDWTKVFVVHTSYNIVFVYPA